MNKNYRGIRSRRSLYTFPIIRELNQFHLKHIIKPTEPLRCWGKNFLCQSFLCGSFKLVPATGCHTWSPSKVYCRVPNFQIGTASSYCSFPLPCTFFCHKIMDHTQCLQLWRQRILFVFRQVVFNRTVTQLSFRRSYTHTTIHTLVSISLLYVHVHTAFNSPFLKLRFSSLNAINSPLQASIKEW